MTNTTTDTLSVNGTVLNNYAWNIETNDGRLRIAGQRGENIVIPGRHGERWVKKKYSPLELDLSMWVQGSDVNGALPSGTALAQWYTNLDVLSQLFGGVDAQIVLQQTRAGRSGAATRQIYGEVTEVIDPTNYTLSPASKFTVGVVCPYPFWSDVSTSVATLSGAGNKTDATFAAGTAPIEDAVIRFTGAATNPSITVGVTTLTYTGTLTSGQWVQFDCGSYTMTANGVAVDYSKITHSGDARWIVIPGGNSTYTVGGTVATTTITATRKYYIG